MRWLLSCLALLAAGGVLAEESIDRAKKEGEVVWYTAMSVPDTDALRKPFVERYPFLKLTVLRATGEKVRTRSHRGASQPLRLGHRVVQPARHGRACSPPIARPRRPSRSLQGASSRANSPTCWGICPTTIADRFPRRTGVR